MTSDGRDILRVLSREQVARLEELGATCTETNIEATEEQIARSGIGSGTRRILLNRGSLTISSGGAYVAGAVHFDGTARLSIDSLSATDSYYVSFSVFLKIADDAYEGNEIIWISDPEGTYGSEVDFWGPGNSNGTTISLDAGPKFFHNNSSDSGCKFPAGEWVSLIGSGNTETGRMALYVNRVAADLTLHGNENLPFLMTYDGLKFIIGDDLFGSVFIGDMADLRVMPNVSLLSGSTIPSETLDLFATADNKPVDPSVATAALGAPCVLFSGNASTFPINKGTGGPFTLTGTLTDASTSPSGD